MTGGEPEDNIVGSSSETREAEASVSCAVRAHNAAQRPGSEKQRAPAASMKQVSLLVRTISGGLQARWEFCACNSGDGQQGQYFLLCGLCILKVCGYVGLPS